MTARYGYDQSMLHQTSAPLQKAPPTSSNGRLLHLGPESRRTELRMDTQCTTTLRIHNWAPNHTGVSKTLRNKRVQTAGAAHFSILTVIAPSLHHRCATLCNSLVHSNSFWILKHFILRFSGSLLQEVMSWSWFCRHTRQLDHWEVCGSRVI